MDELIERVQDMLNTGAAANEYESETLQLVITELHAVREAPVADIAQDGQNGGESALLSAATRAGYYSGVKLRLVPVEGES